MWLGAVRRAWSGLPILGSSPHTLAAVGGGWRRVRGGINIAMVPGLKGPPTVSY